MIDLMSKQEYIINSMINSIVIHSITDSIIVAYIHTLYIYIYIYIYIFKKA